MPLMAVMVVAAMILNITYPIKKYFYLDGKI